MSYSTRRRRAEERLREAGLASRAESAAGDFFETLPEGGDLYVLSRVLMDHDDERGPPWYWNTLHVGEHTGTHFDAPVHWATGKDLPDNACDTIPARRFVGPACVIDVTREVADDDDLLLTADYIRKWEAEHGRIPAGAAVIAAPLKIVDGSGSPLRVVALAPA